MKTILAPVDFSEVTELIVQEAANLARALEARVVLLAVVEPPAVLNEYTALLDVQEITKAGERNAATQLERLADELKEQFINTETTQVSGAPVPLIVEQAAKCEADYIVMGSHGHTAFYDLLVGSTTHGVLKRVHCPVVIVPAEKVAQTNGKKEKRAAAV